MAPPALETCLAERGGLLISGTAGQGNRLAEPLSRGFAVALAGGSHLGQHRSRYVEQPQQLVVPIERVDVEQQRAAGVAIVGQVQLAAAQTPQEPGIDGAEQDLALRGSRAQPGQRVEQVLDLGAREIGVEHQPGPLAKQRFVSVGLELLANAGTHPALPDNGVGHGPAAGPLPENGRLALVGHADGRDVAWGQPGPIERLPGDVQLRSPDHLGIVLDLPRRGQDLGKLFLRRGHGPAVAAKHDGPTGSRALIESQDELGHSLGEPLVADGMLRFHALAEMRSEPSDGALQLRFDVAGRDPTLGRQHLGQLPQTAARQPLFV